MPLIAAWDLSFLLKTGHKLEEIVYHHQVQFQLEDLPMKH